ncbi:MAG: hypothetical protein MRZ74_12305 [Blautia sp.]|nr:hypothetical protein [Blautia sp.]MDY5032142.1 hypothetical protein [Blautia sp.]
MKKTMRQFQRGVKGLKKGLKKDFMNWTVVRKIRKHIRRIRIIQPIYKNGRKIGRTVKCISEVIEKRL